MLLQISKVMWLLQKSLPPYKDGKEDERKFFCQSLLHNIVSKSENLKFPEVALIAVHCKCLVRCIIIARGYRPWNTRNTTAEIYSLKMAMKALKKCKVCLNVFTSVLEQLAVVLQVNFLLTLNHFHTRFSCYYSNFEKVNADLEVRHSLFIKLIH